MSVAEKVNQEVKTLPPIQQRKVLDYARTLRQESKRKKKLRSPMGLWADLNVKITAQDIDQARKEMWGNFPRSDI